MTTWANMNLQDSASPIMEQLIYFHDHTLMIIIMILAIVSYMMIMLFNNKYTDPLSMFNNNMQTSYMQNKILMNIFTSKNKTLPYS